jgi:hypothetical protein
VFEHVLTDVGVEIFDKDWEAVQLSKEQAA